MLLVRSAAACLMLALAAADRFPIRIINLDRDTARLAMVMKQLSSKGVPPRSIERQPAVLGSALGLEELRANSTFLSRLFATRGMIGCYLSHRAFWESTLQRKDADWVLVLEDDVQLEDDFCRRVAAAVDELQSCAETRDTWDVLLIGALGCVNPTRGYGLNRINAFVAGGGRAPRKVTEHIHVPRRPFGTHAYALSKRGAAKLLRRAAIANHHIDAVAWGLPDLQLYCVHPMLAFQAFDDSTIGGTQHAWEALIPNWTLDRYTRVTLHWAYNEPALRIPGTGVTLTIGRSLILGLLGYVAAIVSGSRLFLLAHSLLSLAVFLLLRCMVQPVAR